MDTTNAMIDRRIVRTRAMLHKALMTLILKKNYEAITVKDICAQANVGRSTFYSHYTSKDELKRSGLDNIRRAVIERYAEPATAREIEDRSLGFSLTLFEHARDHIAHYRALVGGHGGVVALDRIRQIVSDLVREELSSTVSSNQTRVIPFEMVVQHIVGAYMAVLTWWLDGGAEIPPDRIDAMFRLLAEGGIKASTVS